jgi:formylglycine-generating enzyme required for sulfatase activity
MKIDLYCFFRAWVLVASLLSMAISEAYGGQCPEGMVLLENRFCFDVHEVTVEEFNAFQKRMDKPISGQPVWSAGNHPVVNVSWFDADSYCKSLGKQLPSEQMWELAASGGKVLTYYPWGEAFDASYANIEDVNGADKWEETSPVGSLKANPFGIYDAIGNAAEWVDDWHRSNDGDMLEFKVYKGGSWYNCEDRVGLRIHNYAPPDKKHEGIGFRCAKSLAR